jgi:RNA polymerase sigma-70 factor, ECF subfamily
MGAGTRNASRIRSEDRMGDQTVGDPSVDPWSTMMRAAMAGDEGVYRRLLEELGRSVRGMARAAFARARLGDADVEDAVQETLLAIHLKRHTWDASQRLGPWVNAIARHKIIDAMRRRGARRVEPIEDFQDFLAAPEAEDPHTLSDAKRLMEGLNPRQRDIVQSISLDGQSIAATASRLGMTEVAVRVALHRSLKALGAAWRRSAA